MKDHIDLTTPCDLSTKWFWNKESPPKPGMYRCHCCSNDTQRLKTTGLVCKNPLHFFYGTHADNETMKSKEARQAGGFACKGVSKSGVKSAEARRGQKRTAEQKENIGGAGRGRHWITNGTKNRKPKIEEPLPDGWTIGAVYTKTTKTKWRCLTTGRISSAQGLTKFQNNRGIDLNQREQL